MFRRNGQEQPRPSHPSCNEWILLEELNLTFSITFNRNPIS